MKQPMSCALALVLAVAAVALPSAATRHKPKAPAAAPPSFTSDYPDAAIGVLIDGPAWTEISAVGPSLSNEECGTVWRLYFPLALFPPHLSRGSTTRMRRFRNSYIISVHGLNRRRHPPAGDDLQCEVC
jgi:hypothetical protein